MATQIQWRRGNTAQTASFTGAVGEATIDTTKNTFVIHDGVTAGGFPLSTGAVALTQNNSITAAFLATNGAFAQANTDFTNVSVAAGTYGNATHYGVVSVAANGRVTSVSTFPVVDSSAIAFSIALG